MKERIYESLEKLLGINPIHPSFPISYIISQRFSSSPKSHVAPILYPKVFNTCRCCYTGLFSSELRFILSGPASKSLPSAKLWGTATANRVCPFLPYDTKSPRGKVTPFSSLFQSCLHHGEDLSKVPVCLDTSLTLG